MLRSEMLLILGRSGTQYVAMVTKLFSTNCGAHLVESYCKEPNIPDTNWLRYLFSCFFDQNLVECMTFAYFKSLNISPKQKEIFENSKQHFSSHAGYLLMF